MLREDRCEHFANHLDYAFSCNGFAGHFIGQTSKNELFVKAGELASKPA